MTSDSPSSRSGPTRTAYVWVWLPGSATPVVAGALAAAGQMLHGDPVLVFRYAQSYLARPEAMSLWTSELPLEDRVFDPRRPEHHQDPVPLASCLRDAVPDAWGRRVINLRLGSAPGHELDELTYLLGSGSNRIGALDFQASPKEYVARDETATLDQLLRLAELVEAGEEVPASLAAAVQHGTSVGGARPKALLDDGMRQLVAKFSSATDEWPVVKAEALSMLLAHRAGLNVAPVEFRRVNGKDVLLVERFDRVPGADGSTTRKAMVSMLTILGLRAEGSWGSSYASIAQDMRAGLWVDVPETLREMFSRLVFNIMVGNNDDHLRNQAAFWDGRALTLTPAYDIAPQIRNTNTSSQAIGITRDGLRASQLRLAREVAPEFLLDQSEAVQIIDELRSTIVEHWDDCADQAQLTRPERDQLRGRQFLNPYIDYSQA